MQQQRFLVNYIDPISGCERLGTGPEGGTFHRYANVKNVIRFGLAKEAFPPGQYNIYSWPEGSGYSACKFITVAYKKA